LKKRLFPGIDSLLERKRFAIFHTCTLVIAPIIAALFIFIINLCNSFHRVLPWLSAIPLNPFANINHLLLWSLFIWNFLGSIRFYEDIRKTGRFFFSRFIVLVLLIGFPFLYFYNFLCILKESKRNSQKEIIC